MGTEITERYQREDFRNIFNSVKQRKIQFGYNSRWHSDGIFGALSYQTYKMDARITKVNCRCEM